jgi:hypothetical protein
MGLLDTTVDSSACKQLLRVVLHASRCTGNSARCAQCCRWCQLLYTLYFVGDSDFLFEVNMFVQL